MTKTIILNNEELSLVTYALICNKQNLEPEAQSEIDKLLYKIEQIKFDK